MAFCILSLPVVSSLGIIEKSLQDQESATLDQGELEDMECHGGAGVH